MYCGQYNIPLAVAKQIPIFLGSHGYVVTTKEKYDDSGEYLWLGQVANQEAGVGLWIIQGCLANRRLITEENSAVVYIIYPKPWLWSLMRRWPSKNVRLAMAIEDLLESEWGDAIRPTKEMLRTVFSARTAK